ncbi:MAG TPA: NUDIX hydrolase [Nannocystaceae bacterium]|nr:NUDIX hydrolase [Nannocystaceae bacterium]
MAETSVWRVLHERHLASYRVFGVSELGMSRIDTGQTHVFYRIDSVDWVNVIPVTADGHVVMVRQYRHGLGRATLEIPGGIVDAGESPVATAARELLEETGWQAGAIEPIGSVSPNPALFGNRLHAFLATGCEHVGEIVNDETEHTTVELVRREDIDAKLLAGEIDHALVHAAFGFWRLRNDASSPW